MEKGQRCYGCNQLFLTQNLHCCKCIAEGDVWVEYDEWDEYAIHEAVRKERTAKEYPIPKHYTDTYILPYKAVEAVEPQMQKQRRCDNMANYYVAYDNWEYDIVCYNCGGPVDYCKRKKYRQTNQKKIDSKK